MSQQITTIAYTSVVVALVAAALLALALGRRRGTILAWLGIGAVASAAISWAPATGARAARQAGRCPPPMAAHARSPR